MNMENTLRTNGFLGRAMAQALRRQPLTAETRARFQVSPCGICGGQSGTGKGFPPEYFGFSLSISFYRCSITRKNKKIIIFIVITGLHNKPQGCGASVASAAGPFTIQKVTRKCDENKTSAEQIQFLI
jgi:hypothetical protein